MLVFFFCSADAVCADVGEIKASDAKDDATNRYTLALPGERHVVDARAVGNVGGFMNHACKSNSNCLYQAVLLDGQPSVQVGIFTRKPVPPNTELTVDCETPNPQMTRASLTWLLTVALGVTDGDSFCQPTRSAQTPSKCLCSEGCANYIATLS